MTYEFYIYRSIHININVIYKLIVFILYLFIKCLWSPSVHIAYNDETKNERFERQIGHEALRDGIKVHDE